MPPAVPRKKRAKAQETESKAPLPQDIGLDEAEYTSQAQVIARGEELGAKATELEYTELFLQYMEANAGLGLDPLSDEAIRFQAKFVARGVHPFDVLKRIQANPFCATRDRIAAAKTLLEYTMRKVPSQLELSGPNGSSMKLDHKQLSALSDEELSALEALLTKASGAANAVR